MIEGLFVKNSFCVAESFDRKRGIVFCLRTLLTHFFFFARVGNAVLQKYFKTLNKVECLSLKMYPDEFKRLTGSLLPYNHFPGG